MESIYFILLSLEPSAERFSFVRCAAMSKLQKRLLFDKE